VAEAGAGTGAGAGSGGEGSGSGVGGSGGTGSGGAHLSEEDLLAAKIDPAWLEVDRVLGTRVNRRSGGDTEYLVKWRKLDYDACTWEPAEFVEAEAGWAVERWRHFRRLEGGAACPSDGGDDGGGGGGVGGGIGTGGFGGSGGGGGVSSSGSAAATAAATAASAAAAAAASEPPPFTPFTTTPEWLRSAGGDLHQYQVEGVNWLRHAHRIQKHVILADEMGLGKTVGSGRYRSPRHRMLFKQRNEDSKCLSMIWRAKGLADIVRHVI